MPNSLRTKLSKLRYEGHITDAEYKELIDKLDGHDKVLLDDHDQELIRKFRELQQKVRIRNDKRKSNNESGILAD